MSTIRFTTFVSLGFLLLSTCARLAGAQTYVWTDERGVVHAASDPSEVPAKQREKAVRDAAGPSTRVTITPADDSVPAAAAPSAPSIRARSEPEPRSFEGDAPAETSGGGVGLDAKPEVTPEANAVPPKPKEYTGKGLPPPDPGFEWHCPADPEGGPPKCEQFEKRTNRRERRVEAREKARKALGVGPNDEFDPDLAKRVDQRAEEEFKKTTPVPATKAPERSEDDEENSDESESPDDPED